MSPEELAEMLGKKGTTKQQKGAAPKGAASKKNTSRKKNPKWQNTNKGKQNKAGLKQKPVNTKISNTFRTYVVAKDIYIGRYFGKYENTRNNFVKRTISDNSVLHLFMGPALSIGSSAWGASWADTGNITVVDGLLSDIIDSFGASLERDKFEPVQVAALKNMLSADIALVWNLISLAEFEAYCPRFCSDTTLAIHGSNTTGIWDVTTFQQVLRDLGTIDIKVPTGIIELVKFLKRIDVLQQPYLQQGTARKFEGIMLHRGVPTMTYAQYVELRAYILSQQEGVKHAAKLGIPMTRLTIGEIAAPAPAMLPINERIFKNQLFGRCIYEGSSWESMGIGNHNTLDSDLNPVWIGDMESVAPDYWALYCWLVGDNASGIGQDYSMFWEEWREGASRAPELQQYSNAGAAVLGETNLYSYYDITGVFSNVKLSITKSVFEDTATHTAQCSYDASSPTQLDVVNALVSPDQVANYLMLPTTGFNYPELSVMMEVGHLIRDGKDVWNLDVTVGGGDPITEVIAKSTAIMAMTNLLKNDFKFGSFAEKSEKLASEAQ